MIWFSIMSAVAATISVAIATWLGISEWKRYKLDNQPQLVFSLSEDAHVLVELNDNEGLDRHGRHPYFRLKGTLKNVTNTPAIRCEFFIFRLDNGGYRAFEKNVLLSDGLCPGENVEIDMEIGRENITIYTDAIKMFSGIPQAIFCAQRPGTLCQFALIFTCKNRFGTDLFTVYRVSSAYTRSDFGDRIFRETAYCGAFSGEKHLNRWIRENAHEPENSTQLPYAEDTKETLL